MAIAIDVLGADGSVWELLNPASGVQLIGGIRGLHLPPVEGQWSTSAGLDGRRRRGQQVLARQVVMDVQVGDLSGSYRRDEAWRALDGAWWSALGGGEQPFTLRVSTDALDGLGRRDVRTLQLWDESDDDGYPQDPAVGGSHIYEVSAGPESAAWSGPTVRQEFTYNPGADVDYYGGPDGGGYGPPYYIGGGSQFANATVTNPGQRPAWARWTILAPFGSASIGLPGRTIPLPFAQVASQSVVIDTNPRRRSIRDGRGNNLWPLVGPGLDPIFAPIPAGASIPLAITLDRAEQGAGVIVEFEPEYRRAWGR